jgi:hypothetical protein
MLILAGTRRASSVSQMSAEVPAALTRRWMQGTLAPEARVTRSLPVAATRTGFHPFRK